MNRILPAKFLIIILVIAAQSQTIIESKTVKDEDDNFVQYSFYRNADNSEVRHGKYTQFLANGRKMFEINYLNGKCSGPEIWYWPENGRKQAEGFCRSDMLTGVWTRWHPNGKKESECSYENDKLNGICKFWSESGEFVEKVKYVEGKPRAFAEWEKHNTKNVFLYARITFRLDKLEFTSQYANIKKEFELSGLEALIDSLPKNTWDGGKVVAIQGSSQRNQADYKRMFEIIGEMGTRLRAKGFRILPVPCC